MEFYAPFKNAEVDPQNWTETSVATPPRYPEGSSGQFPTRRPTPKAVRSRLEAEGGVEGTAAAA